MMGRMASGEDWRRLADAVVARRVEMGMRTRQALAEALQMSARNLGDIEKARRTSYDPATLARLEQVLRWEPGSVDAVLAGGDPKPALEMRQQDLAVDPRSLERYGDDLELMAAIVDTGLPPASAFRLVLAVRQRRAALHRQLVEETKEAAARLAAGDPDWRQALDG
jgi:transcriptional regulator with XRE-family HTH domain